MGDIFEAHAELRSRSRNPPPGDWKNAKPKESAIM